jgi:hypothetical protein
MYFDITWWLAMIISFYVEKPSRTTNLLDSGLEPGANRQEHEE